MAFAAGPTIVMQSCTIHIGERPLALLYQLGKKAARPSMVGAVWPGGNVRQPYIETRNPLDKSPELDRIFIAGEIAAAAPAFIPNAPVANSEWLRGASGLT